MLARCRVPNKYLQKIMTMPRRSARLALKKQKLQSKWEKVLRCWKKRQRPLCTNTRTFRGRVHESILAHSADALSSQSEVISRTEMLDEWLGRSSAHVSADCLPAVLTSLCEKNRSLNSNGKHQKKADSKSCPQGVRSRHNQWVFGSAKSSPGVDSSGGETSVELNSAKLPDTMPSPVVRSWSPGSSSAERRTPVVLMQKLPKFCQPGSPISVSSLSRMNSPAESLGNPDCLATQTTAVESLVTCINQLQAGNCCEINHLHSDRSSGTQIGQRNGSKEIPAGEVNQNTDNSSICNSTEGLVLSSLELTVNDRIDDRSFNSMVEACTRLIELHQSSDRHSPEHAMEDIPCESISCSGTEGEHSYLDSFSGLSQDETGADGRRLMTHDQTCSVSACSSIELGQELAHDSGSVPPVSAASTVSEKMTTGSKSVKRRKRRLSQDTHTATSLSSLLGSERKSCSYKTSEMENSRAGAELKLKEVPPLKRKKRPVYRCNCCDFRTHDKEAKGEHMRTCHPYCCPFCRRRFSCLVEFDAHKSACAEKSYRQCAACNKPFYYSRRKQHFHSQMHSLIINAIQNATRQTQLYGNSDRMLSGLTCEASSKCKKCHSSSSNMEQIAEPETRMPGTLTTNSAENGVQNMVSETLHDASNISHLPVSIARGHNRSVASLYNISSIPVNVPEGGDEIWHIINPAPDFDTVNGPVVTSPVSNAHNDTGSTFMDLIHLLDECEVISVNIEDPSVDLDVLFTDNICDSSTLCHGQNSADMADSQLDTSLVISDRLCTLADATVVAGDGIQLNCMGKTSDSIAKDPACGNVNRKSVSETYGQGHVAKSSGISFDANRPPTRHQSEVSHVSLSHIDSSCHTVDSGGGNFVGLPDVSPKTNQNVGVEFGSTSISEFACIPCEKLPISEAGTTPHTDCREGLNNPYSVAYGKTTSNQSPLKNAEPMEESAVGTQQRSTEHEPCIMDDPVCRSNVENITVNIPEHRTTEESASAVHKMSAVIPTHNACVESWDIESSASCPVDSSKEQNEKDLHTEEDGIALLPYARSFTASEMDLFTESIPVILNPYLKEIPGNIIMLECSEADGPEAQSVAEVTAETEVNRQGKEKRLMIPTRRKEAGLKKWTVDHVATHVAVADQTAVKPETSISVVNEKQHVNQASISTGVIFHQSHTSNCSGDDMETVDRPVVQLSVLEHTCTAVRSPTCTQSVVSAVQLSQAALASASNKTVGAQELNTTDITLNDNQKGSTPKLHQLEDKQRNTCLAPAGRKIQTMRPAIAATKVAESCGDVAVKTLETEGPNLTAQMELVNISSRKGTSPGISPIQQRTKRTRNGLPVTSPEEQDVGLIKRSRVNIPQDRQMTDIPEFTYIETGEAVTILAPVISENKEIRAIKVPNTPKREAAVCTSTGKQTVLSTSTGKQTIIRTPTVKHIVMNTPPEKQTFVNTPTAEQAIVCTPTRKMTAVSTATGKRPIMSILVGKHTDMSIPTRNQTVKSTSTERTAVCTPTRKQTAVSTPTGKQTAVSTPTGKQTAVSTPTEKQTDVSTPTEKQTVMSTPTGKQTVMSAPTGKQTVMSTPTGKQTVMSTPTGKQTVMSTPTEKQTVMSTPTGKQTVMSTPTGKQTVMSTPTGKQTVMSTPTGKQTAVSTPTGKQTAVSTPTGKQTVVSTPTGKQTAVSTPTGKQTVMSTPTGKQTAVSTPTGKQTAVSTPTGKQTAVSTPTGKQTVVSTPTGKQTAVSTPTRKQTALSTPTEKQTDVRTPTEKQTVMSTPTGKQTVMSTPTGKRTVMSTPTGKQTVMSTPTGKQTVMSTPTEKQTVMSTPTGKQTVMSTPTGKQTVMSTPTEKQTVMSTPTGKQTVMSTPTGRQTVMSTPTGKQTAVSTPTGKQTAVSTPTGKQTVVSTPTGKQTAVSTPTGKQTVMSTPTGKQTAVSTPTGKQTAVSTPTGKQTAVSTPTGKQTAVSTPTGKQTAVSTPTGKQTVMSTPTGKQTAMSSPIGKQTAVSTPTGTQTVMSTPTGKRTAVSTPTGKQTVVSTPTGKQTAMSTPTGEQTVMSTPTGKQTVMSTPTGKQTAVSTPTGKQTAMNTPTGKQTVVSTPTGKRIVVNTPTGRQTALGTPTGKQTAMSTPTRKQTIVSTPTEKQIVTPTLTGKQTIVNTSAEKHVVSTPTGRQTIMSTLTGKHIILSTSAEKQTAVSTPKQTIESIPKQTVENTPKQSIVGIPDGKQTDGTIKQTLASSSKQTVVNTPKQNTPKRTVVSTPKPAVVSTPKPAVVSTPKPTVVSTPKPTVVNTPKPTVVSTPKPTEVNTPKPTEVNTPKPTVVNTPKPTVVSTPKPTVMSTPKPTVGSTPKPAVVSTPKQTVVGQPKQAVSTPKQAVMSIPKQAIMNSKHTVVSTPKQAVKNRPKETVESIQKQTVENTPKQTVENTPKRTVENTPKQIVENTPISGGIGVVTPTAVQTCLSSSTMKETGQNSPAVTQACTVQQIGWSPYTVQQKGQSPSSVKQTGQCSSTIQQTRHSSSRIKQTGQSFSKIRRTRQTSSTGKQTGQLSSSAKKMEQITPTVKQRGQSSSTDKQTGQSSSTDKQTGQSSSTDKQAGQSSSTDKQTGQSSSTDKQARQRSSTDKQTGQSSSTDKQTGQSSSTVKQTGQSSSTDKQTGQSSSTDKQTGQSSSKNKQTGQSSSTVKQTGQSSSTDKQTRQSSSMVKQAGRSSSTVKQTGQSSSTDRQTRQSSSIIKQAGQSSSTDKQTGRSSSTVKQTGQSSSTDKQTGQSSCTVEQTGLSSSTDKQTAQGCSTDRQSGQSSSTDKQTRQSSSTVKQIGQSSLTDEQTGHGLSIIKRTRQSSAAVTQTGQSSSARKRMGINSFTVEQKRAKISTIEHVAKGLSADPSRCLGSPRTKAVGVAGSAVASVTPVQYAASDRDTRVYRAKPVSPLTASAVRKTTAVRNLNFEQGRSRMQCNTMPYIIEIDGSHRSTATFSRSFDRYHSGCQPDYSSAFKVKSHLYAVDNRCASNETTSNCTNAMCNNNSDNSLLKHKNARKRHYPYHDSDLENADKSELLTPKVRHSCEYTSPKRQSVNASTDKTSVSCGIESGQKKGKSLRNHNIKNWKQQSENTGLEHGSKRTTCSFEHGSSQSGSTALSVSEVHDMVHIGSGSLKNVNKPHTVRSLNREESDPLQVLKKPSSASVVGEDDCDLSSHQDPCSIFDEDSSNIGIHANNKSASGSRMLEMPCNDNSTHSDIHCKNRLTTPNRSVGGDLVTLCKAGGTEQLSGVEVGQNVVVCQCFLSEMQDSFTPVLADGTVLGQFVRRTPGIREGTIASIFLPAATIGSDPRTALLTSLNGRGDQLLSLSANCGPGYLRDAPDVSGFSYQLL